LIDTSSDEDVSDTENHQDNQEKEYTNEHFNNSVDYQQFINAIEKNDNIDPKELIASALEDRLEAKQICQKAQI
jgi:hypothetical protein